jgi:hypothetical protein
MIAWLRWLLHRPGAPCPVCRGRGVLYVKLDTCTSLPCASACHVCYGKGTR